MANVITNLLTIDADKPTLEKILASVQDNEEGIGSIDFNKIIPMPQELKIESGTITDEAISAYASMIKDDDPKRFNEVITAVSRIPYLSIDPSMSKADIEELANRRGTTPEGIAILGKRYVDNQMEHGALTWFEWCTKNWGTKWNAYPCSFSRDGNTLSFETAWSTPTPVIEALSKMHPEIPFTIQWADEDIGANVGRQTYVDGHVVDGCILQEYSAEAFDMAFETLGTTPEDEGFRFDEVKGTYVFDENADRVVYLSHDPSVGDKSLSVDELIDMAKEKRGENSLQQPYKGKKADKDEPAR